MFGIHGDEVVHDDGAHGEGTESVGEGVEGVVGDHGHEQTGRQRDGVSLAFTRVLTVAIAKRKYTFLMLWWLQSRNVE